MNKITPREYSVITGHTVIVYSNGQAYMAYDGMLMTIPDSRIKIDEADLDNIYYPDGTSEWERMANKPLPRCKLDYSEYVDADGDVDFSECIVEVDE